MLASETDKHWKIGYVSGSFDLFHIGHLKLLQRAKERCDFLIAGVLTDELIFKHKGKMPVIPLSERIKIIESVKYVDKTDITTPDIVPKIDAWKKLKFDVMFTGDDHLAETREEKALNEVGVDLVFFPYTKERSTTGIRKHLVEEKKTEANTGQVKNITGSLQKLLSLAKTRKAVVWGTGAIAINWFKNCGHLVDTSYLVDNNKEKQGILFKGKKICSPHVLQNESEKIILIVANSRKFKEIAKQACDIMGDKLDCIFYAEVLIYSLYFDKYNFISSVENLFEKENLSTLHNINRKFLDGNPDFGDICEGDEYLVREIAESRSKEEVIVSAGVYDGTTTKMFMNFFGKNLKKIYCFEPNSHNYEVSKKNLENYSENCGLELIKAGLSDKDGEISMGFSADFAGATIDADKFEQCQLETIMVKCLDSVIDETETVTFIKMDIEGAEYDALVGAKKTIVRCKPKLAICLYHRPQDYIRIPLLLKSMVPEYKFYIHHHGKFLLDTVLYAVAKGG